VIYERLGWNALEGFMMKMYSDYFEVLIDDIPEVKTLIKKKPKNNASEQLRLALASMKN
jgi:hypothetical protein